MSIRRRGVSCAALVALVVLAGACSLERSGYQFVRNRPTGTYLKVPEEWTVYGPKDIEKQFRAANLGGERKAFPFISVFDARPDADLDFDITGSRPVGLVRVRDLSPGERDSISFASAREELYDALNAGIESGALPLRSSEEVKHESADGQRIVFSIDDGSGTTSTIDQTSILNREKNRIYLLIVGCRTTCYDKHRKQIDTVVESLTIKES